jgi:predicted nuclease of predicted toxin-antitoxin system
MRFKIDENLPLEVAQLLQAAHFDAVTVLDQGLQGRPDSQIVQACREEERILVTLDRDFANIAAYPPGEFAGFIVLRPHWQDKQHVLALIRRVIPLLAQKPFRTHQLWIVEESRLRIRSGEATL